MVDPRQMYEIAVSSQRQVRKCSAGDVCGDHAVARIPVALCGENLELGNVDHHAGLVVEPIVAHDPTELNRQGPDVGSQSCDDDAT